MIQHHMQQILECQRVVDEYRSMADEEREMIPLELNLYKTDPVINQSTYHADDRHGHLLV